MKNNILSRYRIWWYEFINWGNDKPRLILSTTAETLAFNIIKAYVEIPIDKVAWRVKDSPAADAFLEFRWYRLNGTLGDKAARFYQGTFIQDWIWDDEDLNEKYGPEDLIEEDN